MGRTAQRISQCQRILTREAREAREKAECPFDVAALVVWQHFLYSRSDVSKNTVLRTLAILSD